jgi:D-alanyl-lipoteichoic acid acyltransferase DltB (MBOAT superfamily)
MGLLSLLSLLSWWPGLPGEQLPFAAWCLFSAYCASTGLTDFLTGLLMLTSGYRASEVFQSPLLARSPIDFWSQRWNLLFRNAAYRLIFVPSGGRRRPWVGTALVFLFSAVAHEYLVLAALGSTSGHMTAFFVLQGLATQANAWVRKRTRRRMPRPLGIGATWAWMLLTSPLFFVPILDILPLEQLTLW